MKAQEKIEITALEERRIDMMEGYEEHMCDSPKYIERTRERKPPH